MKVFFRRFFQIYNAIPFPLKIFAAIMIFIQPIDVIKPFGVFIIVFSGLSMGVNRRIKKNFGHLIYEPEKKKQSAETIQVASYSRDLKSAKKILLKIKNYLKQNRLKSEYQTIYRRLETEYKHIQKLTEKIDQINENLKDPQWNFIEINQKIQIEKNKAKPNIERLDKLYELLTHHQLLKEKKTKMEEQITDFNLSIKTIHNKLTMLETVDQTQFDEIETEIQKILNFKLKVSEYEDKLDQEINDHFKV